MNDDAQDIPIPPKSDRIPLSPSLYVPCKHRWRLIKESFVDRFHWVTIERCIVCRQIEQLYWTIRQENGKLKTYCERSVVKIDNNN